MLIAVYSAKKDTKSLKIQNGFKIATSAEAPIMVKLDS